MENQNRLGLIDKLSLLLNQSESARQEALNHSADKKDYDTMRFLVKHGTAPTEDTLIYTVLDDSLPETKFLVEHGVKVTFEAMREAVRMEAYPTIDYLLTNAEEKGSNLLDTALFYLREPMPMVQHLIEHGVPITLGNLQYADHIHTQEEYSVLTDLVNTFIQQEKGEHGNISPEMQKQLQPYCLSLHDQLERSKQIEERYSLTEQLKTAQIAMEKLTKNISSIDKQIGLLESKSENDRLDVKPPPARMQDHLPDTQAQTREQPKDPPRHSVKEKLAAAKVECEQRTAVTPQQQKDREQGMDR